MHINIIKLYNYRNIKQTKINPSDKYNILYGDNGHGKTNILESIYLFGYLKSFRQARNLDFIGKDGDICKATVFFKKNKNSYKYDIDINNSKKTVKINNKKPENYEYLNYIKSVIYSTDELALFRGTNSLRRNFIDRGIFLIDTEYLNLIKKYNFILKSRNIVLKKYNLNNKELELWTDLLVKSGAEIRLKRYRYIEKFNKKFINIFDLIFKQKERAFISYKQFENSLDKIQNDFFESINRKLSKELIYGQTLCGPHLDNVDFYIEDKNLKYYGSQGQLRSILLSIKLAQIYDYKDKFDQFPIFLLDDICSELDSQKIYSLFDYINGNIGQIFITTTCKNNLNHLNIQNSNFYNLNSGVITLG